MTSPPLLDYPRLFALGALVVPLVYSFLTVQTLRRRAVRHCVALDPSGVEMFVVAFGLHLFVLLGSGGILAALGGFPPTGNLVVLSVIATAVYAPPLALGIGALWRYLTSRGASAEPQSRSRLPVRAVGTAFAGWNLAVYPSIGALFVFLS